MYNLSDIRHLHLEISSKCNARCPLCPRNLHGYPYNDGYVEKNIALAEIKKIFSVTFIQQLDEILINGNFGDIVMNPEAVSIIKYFRKHNTRAQIQISTNGGAQNKKFWQSLAELNCVVWFCIDGLEDTNHLYRQNVVYSKVIDNAKTFIKSGGQAHWQMIDFDFNQHQQQTARELAADLGFVKFRVMREGRNQAPVFDKLGNLTHTIGKPQETDFSKILFIRQNSEVLIEDIEIPPVKPIQCWAKKNNSIYVSSTGDVYPCCYTGFNPVSYGHGNYMQVINNQLKKIIQKNNALEYSLEECIKWFDAVEESWQDPSFDHSRLIECQNKCGRPWKDNHQTVL